MRTTVSRNLMLTLASALAIAVVAACSDNAPTGLTRIFGEDPSTILIVNDNDSVTGQCTSSGATLKAANGNTRDRDLNGDGYVCVTSERGKKH